MKVVSSGLTPTRVGWTVSSTVNSSDVKSDNRFSDDYDWGGATATSYPQQGPCGVSHADQYVHQELVNGAPLASAYYGNGNKNIWSRGSGGSDDWSSSNDSWSMPEGEQNTVQGAWASPSGSGSYGTPSGSLQVPTPGFWDHNDGGALLNDALPVPQVVPAPLSGASNVPPPLPPSPPPSSPQSGWSQFKTDYMSYLKNPSQMDKYSYGLSVAAWSAAGVAGGGLVGIGAGTVVAAGMSAAGIGCGVSMAVGGMVGSGVGATVGGKIDSMGGPISQKIGEIGGGIVGGMVSPACFVAGTQVVVGVNPDGSYATENIEDIQVGDYVLTRAERSHRAAGTETGHRCLRPPGDAGAGAYHRRRPGRRGNDHLHQRASLLGAWPGLDRGRRPCAGHRIDVSGRERGGRRERHGPGSRPAGERV